jgi:hypothetical protein
MGMGLLRIPDPSEPFERGLTLASAPGFASPEALAGKSPSFASEVFGVGVLACLLLDGRMPSGAGGHELLPAASWPTLSALERFSLSALLCKAIAPQANRRYVGVEALAEDLRAWLAGESHSALPLNPMPVTAASGAIAYESSLPAWPPRPSAARRALWASLVLAGMTAVAAGLWYGPRAWPGLMPGGAGTPPAADRVVASLPPPQPDRSVEASPEVSRDVSREMPVQQVSKVDATLAPKLPTKLPPKLSTTPAMAEPAAMPPPAASAPGLAAVDGAAGE